MTNEHNNASVIDGMPNYVGSSAKTRHTVALVTWNDPDDLYRQKVEYVEDREGIARYGVVTTEVTAFGCTSRSQAHRVGKWLLFTEPGCAETDEGAIAPHAHPCLPRAGREHQLQHGKDLSMTHTPNIAEPVALPDGLTERLKRSIAWLERGELLPGHSACIGLDDIKALHSLIESRATPPAAAPAPASSQDEPFGYFRAEPFGWTDCAATDEGAIALYERPAAPAVPQREPEAYMVYGNYTRQPFRSIESAQSYMGGLLKSDPEGGYHIRPLFYATPAAPSQEPVPGQQPDTFRERNAQFREQNWQIRFDAAVEARRQAQEQLYSERERHNSEIQALRQEISRLLSSQQPVTLTDEPWYGHKFKEVTRGVWHCECGKTVNEGATPCTNGTQSISTMRRDAVNVDATKMHDAGSVVHEGQGPSTRVDGSRSSLSGRGTQDDPFVADNLDDLAAAPTSPLRDVRTCRERQDDTIAALREKQGGV